ncbi:hypothetical protein NDU88_001825 [Pleurodeles waltl]|uniref:Uncharacterized protein n=1 Tax=Pleurodeles waltl TaxID=8319 RepID=A0AAV7VC34_PLEWA|nr:hypothetical protein NDU88_001825 [Pleurodeles waltl]
MSTVALTLSSIKRSSDISSHFLPLLRNVMLHSPLRSGFIPDTYAFSQGSGFHYRFTRASSASIFIYKGSKDHALYTPLGLILLHTDPKVVGQLSYSAALLSKPDASDSKREMADSIELPLAAVDTILKELLDIKSSIASLDNTVSTNTTEVQGLRNDVIKFQSRMQSMDNRNYKY